MREVPISSVIRQLETLFRLFDSNIEMLDEHIADVDRNLNRIRKNFEDSLARKVRRLSGPERQELGDIYADELHKVEQLFPTIHRRSYLITIIGGLENYLNRLCRYAKQALKLKLDVTDLRGAGIERAITYLKKIINVEVPQSGQWKEISVAQVIRNLVVHNDGYLKKNDSPSSRVREYAKKSKRLNMSDRDEIVLTEEFLPALLEDVREFAEQLKQAMEKRLANDT